MQGNSGHHFLLVLHAVGAIFLAMPGCAGGTDATPDAATDNGIVDSGPEFHAVTSATPLVDGTRLKSGHPGWKKADCTGCHLPEHGGLTPSECTTCHGGNGALLRKTNHSNAGCAGCHGGSHPDAGFDSPEDCRACHKYAAGDGCPKTEEVDVVIIGAGGGGLSAASHLAQSGLDVVVLERHNKVGGCMTNFQRGAYRFEVSLHAMGGFDEPDGANIRMFKDLGIWDKVQMVRSGTMYSAVYPDFTFRTSSDVDEYLARLKEKFPDESDGLDLLFAHLLEAEEILDAAVAQLNGDGEAFQKLMAENLEGVNRFLGYLDKTLSQVLADYVTDQKLIAVLTQLACYAGAEPDRVSSLFFIMMWNSYHRHGFYYPVGGSQSVSDALAETIRENGGTIRLNTEATRIVIEDGKAVKVITRDDVCYSPRYVVSNANAPATIDMIGRENLPEGYLAAVDAMTVGMPATVVYLGIDYDYTDVFDDTHEIILQDSYDPHDVFQSGFDCKPGENLLLLIANYSELDPTAAPEGKNVITLTGLMGFDCFEDVWGDHEAYKEAKDTIAQVFIQRAEEVLPGLRDHIEVLEVAAPQTTWAYTGNPGGSFVGWDTPPEQSILNRLAQETPIENLFLAGAWTFPGGGQATVLLSGGFAADKILALEDAR